MRRNNVPDSVRRLRVRNHPSVGGYIQHTLSIRCCTTLLLVQSFVSISRHNELGHEYVIESTITTDLSSKVALWKTDTVCIRPSSKPFEHFHRPQERTSSKNMSRLYTVPHMSTSTRSRAYHHLLLCHYRRCRQRSMSHEIITLHYFVIETYDVCGKTEARSSALLVKIGPDHD